MDTAVPLGIIINELISNALKHAFSGMENGEISVCLKKEENGNYFSLTVRDNGRGFPEDIDFRETESLGLQLVINLVDQIEGSIELNTTGQGTEFRIRFKELRYRQKV
ncbi:putative sensor histidine kinase pdtaS [bioreactor metagenome]|uniref:Putative sensor histidine kinase pdtaS n=1 Tax=bioreactor metagenome TaxID=1076179 RepID=A0A645JL67_9ZZZZ